MSFFGICFGADRPVFINFFNSNISLFLHCLDRRIAIPASFLKLCRGYTRTLEKQFIYLSLFAGSFLYLYIFIFRQVQALLPFFPYFAADYLNFFYYLCFNKLLDIIIYFPVAEILFYILQLGTARVFLKKLHYFHNDV